MTKNDRAITWVVFWLACVASAGAVWAVLTRDPVLWQAMRQATCMPSDCFTEAVGQGPIRQPIGAWTSLVFAFLGLWILRPLSAKAESREQQRWNFLFAFAMLVTGLGSFFYHASLTYVGQATDVLGMYLTVIAIVLVRRSAYRPIQSAAFWSVFALLVTATAAIQILLPDLRRVLFFLLVVVTVANEVTLQRAGSKFPPRNFLMALGFLAVGFCLWLVDRYRLAGDGESLFQGHAVWHLLGAAASMRVYRFMEEGLQAQSSRQ